ncbi:DUF3231 family protein [Bacillus sp. BRMEA1]|uniref:DUF3231 family protein n=1 Tax=Neobacillus endophyticus TaxID=2738405 RepID=UPI00156772CB|nr:DUF3231 family protein [Neobacillus endophyticus]NRD76998.1 DUF3231 family protein [Neobacillus endophyticus]
MDINSNRLTSPEITNLHLQFIQETISICVSKHVLATVKDPEVRSLFEFSLGLSENHVKALENFFKLENFPVPDGFREKDVNLDSPPLFVDTFWLNYLHTLSHTGLTGYSLAFGNSLRQDIQDYYYQCNIDAMEVHKKTISTLVAKGLYEKPPHFSTPKRVEYITSFSYSFDVIGKKRPLNTAEAGSVFFNLSKTRLAKALTIGFIQVVKNKDFRKFLESNLRDINQNYGIFSSILQEANLKVPKLLDTYVTNSTVAPFSDRLMANIAGFLASAAISYYGTALVSSMRIDLIVHCEAAILGGLKQLSKFGNVAVNNGWIEKLPQADDRKELPIN